MDCFYNLLNNESLLFNELKAQYVGSSRSGHTVNLQHSESTCRKCIAKLGKSSYFVVNTGTKNTVTDTFVSITVSVYGCGGKTRTYDLRALVNTNLQYVKHPNRTIIRVNIYV